MPLTLAPLVPTQTSVDSTLSSLVSSPWLLVGIGAVVLIAANK